MHTLWTYDGNAIRRWTVHLKALLLKIQNEDCHKLRQEWRHEALQLVDTLYQEQRRLHRILSDIERDWDLYMDQAGLREYYEHLSGLYLKAGGHWAGKQEPESNEMYTLTHLSTCPTCGQEYCVCGAPTPLCGIDQKRTASAARTSCSSRSHSFTNETGYKGSARDRNWHL